MLQSIVMLFHYDFVAVLEIARFRRVHETWRIRRELSAQFRCKNVESDLKLYGHAVSGPSQNFYALYNASRGRGKAWAPCQHATWTETRHRQ
jgi:hypothetical protein